MHESRFVSLAGHEWTPEKERQLAEKQWSELERLTERLLRQDGYSFFQPHEEEEQDEQVAEVETKSPAVEHHNFSIGDSVMVQERTMRGSNKEGGLARIVGFNARDGTYGVKYLLSNKGEDGVAPRYITPVDTGVASPDGRRSKRSRTEAKDTYDPSKEAAKPQLKAEKKEKKETKDIAPPPTAHEAPAAQAMPDGGPDMDPEDIYCMTCGRSDQDEQLVLCDGCENGRHTFCCDPPLPGVPEGDWYCGLCQGPPIDLSGPLDLTLVKRKALARAYAQDGTDEQKSTGLSQPKTFPDLAKVESDVAAMCEPVLASQPRSDGPGSHYREAQKLLEMARGAVQTLRQRQDEERLHMGKLSRYARRLERNNLPAMQGEWRRKPYALRDYTPIEQYVPVEGLTKEEGEAVLDQLDTELEGLLSYTYSYEEKTNDSDRCRQQASLRQAGVAEGEVVEAEVQAVLEDLVERVAWVNCPQHPSVRDRALQIGNHLEEIPVWGMDSYSRRNVEMALEDMPVAPGTRPLSNQERSMWIERTLAPAINRQGANGYDIKLALEDLLDRATTAQSRRMAQAVLESFNDLGQEHFRVHPKGTGVVCRVTAGIPAQEFVTEYLGELVPPWRWFEKQEAVEAAQKHFGQKPTLPDFYNMLMERHRDDSRGYAVLYIDAAERNNFASSLSHSCEPNCRTTVAAIGKKYSVCLYTVRHIEPGEELTIDYSAATENEKEFRSAVCLCGSHACRGSFLYFTGANESQQVLQRDHTIVDRFAQLVLACSNTQVMIPTQEIMNRHGLRKLCVGAVPEWLTKFVGLALKFVDTERAALPLELLQAPEVDHQKHSYKTADAESRQMLEQRVQNLAITLSRLRYFLGHQFTKICDPKLGYDGQLCSIPAMQKPIEHSGSFSTQLCFGKVGGPAGSAIQNPQHGQGTQKPTLKQPTLKNFTEKKAAAKTATNKKPIATKTVQESQKRFATDDDDRDVGSHPSVSSPAPVKPSVKPRKKSAGSSPAAKVSWPWFPEELRMLATLVRRDGPSGWPSKAAEMQIGRSSSQLSSAWRRYGERYENTPDVPVPNPEVTAMAEKAKAEAEKAHAAKMAVKEAKAEKAHAANVAVKAKAKRVADSTSSSLNVDITEPGPTGIKWLNKSTADGDRISIAEISPTCPCKDQLSVGLTLTAIAGCTVLKSTFEEVVHVLKCVNRPITLTFTGTGGIAKPTTGHAVTTVTPAVAPAVAPMKPQSVTPVLSPGAQNTETIETAPAASASSEGKLTQSPSDAPTKSLEVPVEVQSKTQTQSTTTSHVDVPIPAPPTAHAAPKADKIQSSNPDNPHGETSAAAPVVGWTGRARKKVQAFDFSGSPSAKAKKDRSDKKVAQTTVTAKQGCAYNAEEDETAKTIAEKLNVDVGDLVLLNKQRYPALTRTRKLRHGTVLLIPDTEGALDGNRVVGNVAAPLPPKHITKVSEIPPPLHVLTDEETIRCMWTGNKSVARRLVEYVHLSTKAHAAEKSLKERLNKKDAKEALRVCEEMTQYYDRAKVRTMPELDEAMRELRQLLRKLPTSSSYGQHRAAADLLTQYIHTSIFFVLQPYINFESEPVRIRARDIDGVLLSRERLIAAANDSGGAKRPRKEPQSIGKPWSDEEIRKLEALVMEHGANNWPERARQLDTGRNASSVGSKWNKIVAQREKATGPSANDEALQACSNPRTVIASTSDQQNTCAKSASTATIKTEPHAGHADQDQPSAVATNQIPSRRAEPASASDGAAPSNSAVKDGCAGRSAPSASGMQNQSVGTGASTTAQPTKAAALTAKGEKKTTKRKARDGVSASSSSTDSGGKAAEAPVVDPVTGDIDQKRVVYQHGKRYSSNFAVEQLIGWFSQEKADNKMPTTRSICGSVFLPDISSCYARTATAKHKKLRSYNHVENKQITAYLNEPLENIERIEVASTASAGTDSKGGDNGPGDAKATAAGGDGVADDRAAQPKATPAKATPATSSSLTSHKAKWPNGVIEQFHLDAVSPAETEAGTWLFGGPCLDYAVTQDRAALRNLVREMQGYKAKAQGSGGKGEQVEEASVKWIQCENPECLKWRKLPSWLRDEELPEKFTCDQNKWVPDQASCGAKEDDFSEEVTVTWSLGDLAGSVQVGDGVDAYCSKHSW